MYLNRAYGAIIRSRAKWIKDGEKIALISFLLLLLLFQNFIIALNFFLNQFLIILDTKQNIQPTITIQLKSNSKNDKTKKKKSGNKNQAEEI